MDLLNMTNRAQIHEFYKKVEKIFIFQATVSKFGDLLGGWKLAKNAKLLHNTSKIITAKPKKTEANEE